MTFANTSGIDYLTKDFEQLTEYPGYDMLYHKDASVVAHTMHAFQHSGTKRWNRICNEHDAVWLLVYLFTEAVVVPHNIRGGRSAIEILDAYMDVRFLDYILSQTQATDFIIRYVYFYLISMKELHRNQLLTLRFVVDHAISSRL